MMKLIDVIHLTIHRVTAATNALTNASTIAFKLPKSLLADTNKYYSYIIQNVEPIVQCSPISNSLTAKESQHVISMIEL